MTKAKPPERMEGRRCEDIDLTNGRKPPSTLTRPERQDAAAPLSEIAG
jgi:hypothetical protein